MSIRAAAKLQGVSRTSALNWIKELAKKIYEKPAPGTAILVELDEMWHYLGSKKNKLWIWKAYRRETGELIDWECGGRDKETFERLIDRLSKWEVELFCTDNWAVYQEVTDEDRLVQSKAQTYYLEQITVVSDIGMPDLGENPSWCQRHLKWWILQWLYLQDFM